MIKKITFFFIAFTALFASSSMAQPGSNATFPYIQTYDSLVAGQIIEGQGGWYLDLINWGYVNHVEVAAQRGLNGSQSMSVHLSDTVASDSTASPLVGTITANTIFGYSYRIVNLLNQAYTLTANAGFKIQIKQDISPVWTTIDSVSLSNHIVDTNFIRIEFPIGSYAGINANFKFVYYQGTPGEEFYIDIDSLVIADPTITAMTNTNGNQTQFNVINNGNNQILINSNINTATKNTVVIYDINGKQVYSNNLNTNAMIDASLWNKGLYLVKITNDKAAITKKIIIH